jgi:hypothetical protein
MTREIPMRDPRQGKPADAPVQSSNQAPVALSEQALDRASGGAVFPSGPTANVKPHAAFKPDMPAVPTELLPAVQKG